MLFKSGSEEVDRKRVEVKIFFVLRGRLCLLLLVFIIVWGRIEVGWILWLDWNFILNFFLFFVELFGCYFFY